MQFLFIKKQSYISVNEWNHTFFYAKKPGEKYWLILEVFAFILKVFGVYLEFILKRIEKNIFHKTKKKFESNKIKLEFLAFEFIQKIDKLVSSI